MRLNTFLQQTTMTKRHSQNNNRFLKLVSTKFIILGLILVSISSCTSRKKILYFQDRLEQEDSTLIYHPEEKEHRISVGDILYISINSMNKELTEMFKKGTESYSSYSMWSNPGNIYINGYSVDYNGDIHIPIIGKINVLNQTFEEARVNIENKIKTFITDASLSVKFLNFQYTFIGEVTKPGTYINYSNRITIFQALGHAGDITIFGDKKDIQLLREYPEGQKIHKIDITQSSIINSEFYYLRPNDVIYIKPVRNKSFRQNLPNIALILSSISTVILVLNFIGKK